MPLNTLDITSNSCFKYPFPLHKVPVFKTNENGEKFKFLRNMITSIPFLIARVPDDSDFFRLKEMTNSRDGWILDYNKNGIKIWSKPASDSTVRMVKVRTVFSGVSSKDLYNTLMDPLYRKIWDTHMVVGYEIGYLNPNNAVTYYGASCPPLKKRDFVLQNSWLDTGSEHYVINHSVCHKDHPPRPGFIRAVSYFTGYFIKSISNGGCEVSFVSQTDPQGIIPSWIINKCTQIFAPRYIRVLENAAFGYSTWKIQNSPNYFPWVHPDQMKSPRISLADCIPSEEEKQSSFYRYLEQKIMKPGPAVQFTADLNLHMCSNVEIAEPSKISFGQKTSNDGFQAKKGTDKKGKKKNKTVFWMGLTRKCFKKKSEA